MDLFFNRPKDILRYIDKPTRLDAILDACLHENVKVGFLKADVVTTKGALVSLLHRTGTFNVSFLDGKLYIDKHLVYDPSPTEIKRSWIINKNGYVGKYGFELACTTPRDPVIDASSRHQAPHGLNDWRAIICTYLGGFNLLLAGDIPCVKAPYTAAPANYMELKCRKLGSDLRKDLKDWYFRAHIMGASGVFVGYRDDEHVLRAKEFIPTTDILARLGTSWDPTDNINRLFQVLYTLREHCQQAVDQLELRNDHRRKDITWNMGFRGGGLYIHELTHDEAEMNIKSARSLPQPLQKRAGILPRSVIKEIQKSVMTRALEMN
ncbi:hypothetical protein V5O48_001491 [Marasmius crinis-equi]|uniref:Decapping nuclease n=1 Tax=Marasmius crinis-equi TaxID=585013 RepID=A0ABR3FYG7_9AGAR